MHVLGTHESLGWTSGMVLDTRDTLPFPGLNKGTQSGRSFWNLVDSWALDSEKPSF